MVIGFVGAGGYGNVGDDMYRIAFRRLLPDHELRFYNSDHPDPSSLEKLDLLVYGGGGLVYHHSQGRLAAHFDYMRWYANRVRCPIGFCSIGVGLKPPFQPNAIAPWSPLLRKAAFITCRSPGDAAVVSHHTNRPTQWHPDLGYWFARTVAPRSEGSVEPKVSRVITLIPRGQVQASKPQILEKLRSHAAQGWRIRLLSLASADDAEAIRTFRQCFPGEEIITRKGPETAVRLIAESGLVITGSFHGLVFARAIGVPVETIPFTWKLEQELKWDSAGDPTLHVLALTSCLPTSPQT